MASVLLVYLAAVLLGVLGLIGLWQFLKRIKKVRIRWGFLVVGLVVSVLYYVLELLLFTSTFGDNIEYYNTLTFRIVVGFLFLAFFCLARLIITKKVFFDRRLHQNGLSFCYGFAGAWSALFTLYLFVMTLVLAYYGIFVGLEADDAGRMIFNDGTAISVFRPLIGHLSFAVFFVSLAVIGVASGAFLAKIVEKKVRPVISAIWIVLLMLFESIAIQMVLYINAIPHWGIAINSVVMALLSVLLVRFVPIPKDAEPYTMQFE